MFNNHLMADIQFIVGSPGNLTENKNWKKKLRKNVQIVDSYFIACFIAGHTQTIPAHKYVLATGSSVFYAMFYGGLAEHKKDIEVPDVEPAAFLALLRWTLKTGKQNLKITKIKNKFLTI